MEQQARIKVLIVDDHDILRQGLSFALSVYPDIEVVGYATDGSEVIKRCDQFQPEVILMDLVMPEMNGVTATQLVREKYPNIQVIALTSFEDKNLIHDAIKAGAISYVLKNVWVEDLVKAIRDAHTGKAMLSPEIIPILAQGLHKEPAPQFQLTEREIEVLRYVVKGYRNVDIATALVISPATVKKHVVNILTKLKVANRTEAVNVALKHNLV
jgi:two-component system, NarL family, response regulator LiaR